MKSESRIRNGQEMQGDKCISSLKEDLRGFPVVGQIGTEVEHKTAAVHCRIHKTHITKEDNNRTKDKINPLILKNENNKRRMRKEANLSVRERGRAECESGREKRSRARSRE